MRKGVTTQEHGGGSRVRKQKSQGSHGCPAEGPAGHTQKLRSAAFSTTRMWTGPAEHKEEAQLLKEWRNRTRAEDKGSEVSLGQLRPFLKPFDGGVLGREKP
jgi:hypothetical protein